MNRTPWKNDETFQETDCRSFKQESHNLHQTGIILTNPKPQRTLRALALSSLLKTSLAASYLCSITNFEANPIPPLLISSTLGVEDLRDIAPLNNFNRYNSYCHSP